MIWAKIGLLEDDFLLGGPRNSPYFGGKRNGWIVKTVNYETALITNPIKGRNALPKLQVLSIFLS